MTSLAPGRPSAHRFSVVPSRPAAGSLRRQEAWLAAGLGLAFLIPFVFTDVVSIDRDLYYGIYSAGVFGFAALWLHYATDSPR
jgi:hypothetical protein